VKRIAADWNAVSVTDQLGPIDRFLEVARQGLPCPQRPNAAELESQRLEYLNKATDVRAAVESQLRVNSIESRRKFFKIAAKIVAFLVIGIVGLSLIGAVQERYATESCPRCAASGKVACASCQGSGKRRVYCTNCGGDQRVGENWFGDGPEGPCKVCSDGTVTVDCYSCSGTGDEVCSVCDGAGKVFKHRAEK